MLVTKIVLKKGTIPHFSESNPDKSISCYVWRSLSSCWTSWFGYILYNYNAYFKYFDSASPGDLTYIINKYV